MNLIDVFERFPDQESCIEHLERIRWRSSVQCRVCEYEHEQVKRKKEPTEGRVGRWHCAKCGLSLKVTHGTVFHGTKIALQKWFLAIALILNAKKGVSSHQLSRDLDLNQKTAWFIMVRIRAEMAKKGGALLQGIVEADETYIGGRPRKENKKEDREPAPRGRGTSKTAIIGVVERGGKVVAEVAEKLTRRRILEFIKRAVKIQDSELMTDEYHAYNLIGREMKHHIINHQEQYADGDKHTNTIEGFWSLLKRAWYGSHHHYTTGFTPLYVAERCYVYNHRKLEHGQVFWKFLGEIF